MKENKIINNSKAFPKIVRFIKKYFKNVTIIRNKNSNLAKLSQNFWIDISFENRGIKYLLRWNHAFCTISIGNTDVKGTASLIYTFTKLAYDDLFPIEEQNNSNIVFWEFEIMTSFDDLNTIISPLRIPITGKN